MRQFLLRCPRIGCRTRRSSHFSPCIGWRCFLPCVSSPCPLVGFARLADFKPLPHFPLMRLSLCHHIPWSVAFLNRRLATLMAPSRSHDSVPTLRLRHVAVIVLPTILQHTAISSRFAACCNKQASCAEHAVPRDAIAILDACVMALRRATCRGMPCVTHLR